MANRRPPKLRRARISSRTENRSPASRALYRIEHYSSIAGLAVAIPILLVAAIVLGVATGFPTGWVGGFEVTASAITLVMVFAIQHTQAREQAATQRKLDELLRATPGATETLMMLEEAPDHVLLAVEQDQREVRAASGELADVLGTEHPGEPADRPSAAAPSATRSER